MDKRFFCATNYLKTRTILLSMKRFTDALEVLHLKVGVTILKIQKIQPAQVNVFTLCNV